jgi:hypothetical protein
MRALRSSTGMPTIRQAAIWVRQQVAISTAQARGSAPKSSQVRLSVSSVASDAI